MDNKEKGKYIDQLLLGIAIGLIIGFIGMWGMAYNTTERVEVYQLPYFDDSDTAHKTIIKRYYVIDHRNFSVVTECDSSKYEGCEIISTGIDRLGEDYIPSYKTEQEAEAMKDKYMKWLRKNRGS